MRLFRLGLVLATAASLPAFADIAPMPYSAGGGPRPMDNAAAGLRMAREDVEVTLHEGFALVDARFWMHNPASSAVSASVGFPGEGVRVEGERGLLAHRPLLGFGAWVGAAPAVVTDKVVEHVTRMGPEGHEYTKRRVEHWHVFELACPPGEQEVRVRYAVLADPHRGDSWSSADRFADASVHYIFATGAGWDGDIGRVVLRVRAAAPVRLQSVRVREAREPQLPKRERLKSPVVAHLPGGMKRARGELTWERTGLEPTAEDNVELLYAEASPRPSDDNFPAEREKRERAALKALAAAARGR